MENRGQKRPEIVDELPADKRACSSLEFKPSSSNSSVQAQMNSTSSTPDTRDANVDTLSTVSASDGEQDRDSAYGSCDSDGAEYMQNDLSEFLGQRSSGDHGKLKRILSTLSNETEDSGQLAALTELCEILSFCTENSLSSVMSDSLSPYLVTLAGHESNPDIMLLAIRAITYLCDVFPRSSGILVRHNAVHALCQRLMAIEYLDVAEQCFQALEKISRDQPLACLQAGAIMAVLTYIDFFSTSVQRVALSTVVHICKKLPSEGFSPLMEAAPILCNLLQYEDYQLVENVAVCLTKIVDRVSQSTEMLDELCKHGLIHHAVQLINLNSRITLSQPIYNNVIGLLVKLASGSYIAFRTLYEISINSILKEILSTYDLSHGMSFPHMVDGHCNQVYEVLKLLNELLPTTPRDLGIQLVLDKEDFLSNHPELLQRLGIDLLPLLIQVVNSGANLYVCYGCLSVLSKLVYLSKSEMLLELFKSTNISSFLAGVFTRKDHHVLILALQIVEMILQKLSDVYLNSFIKEGVFFSIEALVTLDKCSPQTFPVFSSIQFPFDTHHKMAAREVPRCLCYAFDAGQSTSGSEIGSCKLEKDSVHNLAQRIQNTYFSPSLTDSEKGSTDILQRLRTFSAELDDLWNTSLKNDSSVQHEDKFQCILYSIIAKLSGREPISTFEFIESGIVRSLASFLSNGQYLKENVKENGVSGHSYVVGKRFAAFARLCLFPSDSHLDDLPLLVLIRKLQSALSALENFPVILSNMPKKRNSYAAVPHPHCMAHPCMKIRFMRAEEETYLSDLSRDVLTVDPLSSMDAIEAYLWPKVSKKITNPIKSATRSLTQMECRPLQLPSDQGASPDLMESDNRSPDLPKMQQESVGHNHISIMMLPQEDGANLTQTVPERQINCDEATLFEEIHGSADREPPSLSEANTHMKTGHHASCSNDNASQKLQFYLEGQQLDRTLTLYQAILQQQIKAEPEIITGEKSWSQTYTLTYRRVMECKDSSSKECLLGDLNSSLSHEVEGYTSFFTSLFACGLVSDIEKSNPTYDILFLLRSLQYMKRFTFNLICHGRINAFVEGQIDKLDNLKVAVPSVPQNEFVSRKLTEKLEQQMRDSLAVSVGGMPFWCNQLMASCPFLFSFEARCKYLRLAAFHLLQAQPHLPSYNSSGAPSDRQPSSGSLPRRKVKVSRDRVLDSASEMMALHARNKVLLEVEYNEEVGTGLGPTLEFYTLVSHEFQKHGMGMWREDYSSFTSRNLQQIDTGAVMSPYGLFPRPWSTTLEVSDGIQFPEVITKFVLLGQVVAKALHDGRVLDIPFSKAFYKLILMQELSLYDIQSFDPALGQTLLEFQSLVDRKRYLESICSKDSNILYDSLFRSTRIEDLCLDFTLPGYPDYVLIAGPDHNMVNATNLEAYVSHVVDATINSGISRQMEAFKSGFNQVFPIKHLQIFTEEELERLLCGESDSWNFTELSDHIKFDHGYTASSPPINNLLEIILELDHEQRRGFLQFVTGAPRLPLGGLASLNPKLTIVRKHCSKCPDEELPSVMTCANYLKLPPYSTKEKMKERLLYAITEGRGSFHLS